MTGLLMPRRKKEADRSPPEESAAKTQQVRVNGDLAKMLGDIYDVTGEPTAQFLDPLIRASVQAEYDRLRDLIEKIERVRKKGRPSPE